MENHALLHAVIGLIYFGASLHFFRDRKLLSGCREFALGSLYTSMAVLLYDRAFLDAIETIGH